MKQKLLLIASLFVGVCAQAQFNVSNAPEIGDVRSYYGIDSAAPSYASEIGSNAIWDYSLEMGVANEERDIEILDAPTEDTEGDFPSSVKAQEVQGLMTTFYTDDANARTSQGLIYTDPNVGDIVVQFDVDPEKLYAYPFNLGDSFSDNFEGHYALTFQGMPLSESVDGVVHVEIDGKGTLKLADNDYTDVFRYKLTDTVNVQNVPIVGTIKMIRVQYEYYDLNGSNSLPLFVHTNVKLLQTSGTSLSNQSTVMSIEEPSEYVGLQDNVLEEAAVYPNPAHGVLNIQLPSSVQTADININDALGRSVLNTTVKSGDKTLDVSSLKKGVYIIKLSNGAQSSTKRIVIK